MESPEASRQLTSQAVVTAAPLPVCPAVTVAAARVLLQNAPVLRWVERLRSAASVAGPLRIAGIAPAWAVCRRFAVHDLLLGEGIGGTSSIADEWEELGRGDSSGLFGLNPLLDRGEFERRIDEGMTCFAVRHEGQLVHYRWYARSAVWLPFLRLRWIPSPGDYTALDVFTSPAARAHGLHTAISLQGLRRAREMGLRRCISFVAWWNRPSLLVSERIGFVRAGSATLWTLGFASTHSAQGRVQIENGELRVLPPVSR